MLQLAGLDVTYDSTKPARQRPVSVSFDGAPLSDSDRLTVAAPGFLAEGGDLYTVLAETEAIRSAGKVTDVVMAYFTRYDVVSVPSKGRQIDVGR